MVPFENLGAVSHSPSIVTIGCILHQFRDKARYWSQIVIFSYPLHSSLPLGGSLLECCHPIWCGKTIMVWLSDGGKTLRISATVYTQYRRVTDGRNDGQRDGQTYASRSKNPLPTQDFTEIGNRLQSYSQKTFFLKW